MKKINKRYFKGEMILPGKVCKTNSSNIKILNSNSNIKLMMQIVLLKDLETEREEV